MKLSQFIAILRKNIGLHVPGIFREPLLLHVDITNRCNLRCRHCDVWRFKKKKDLDYVIYKRLIDESSALGLKFVAISGGEPLLHKDLLKFISCSKRRGMYVNLSTNGVLINDAIISDFKKSKLDSITVSLDSTQQKYDLDRKSVV
jgi:MoaA/NifB/PqqE/SkfB family radical SAM enzyme